ncbi:hypothetical protein HMPREF3038_02482 [Akkermansia sp. KLE1797]|nr:hypothetical protein HMPREF3038_02482 [Akkermansia sp. KLE1797]KXU54784.1 hypothetical protein HMPREF3039_00931 [Akkermansia sp. KLE1798]
MERPPYLLTFKDGRDVLHAIMHEAEMFSAFIPFFLQQLMIVRRGGVHSSVFRG